AHGRGPAAAPATRLGTGTAGVPALPQISAGCNGAATAAKLLASGESAPDSWISTPVTCVAVVTGMVSPAGGPEPIVRWSRGRLDAPITAETGPSRVTRAWM